MKRKGSITYRSLLDILYKAFVFTMVLLVLATFLWILGTFLFRGLHHINIELFYRSLTDSISAQLAQESGDKILGGIANGLYGSAFIILIALLIAVPLGIGLGLYMFGIERKNILVSGIYYSCTILRGIPSIITGIIVYLWIVVPMGSFSALAGGVALAIMMFPEIAYSTFISFRSIPESLKESAFSLTGNKQTVIFTIFFPLISRKIWANVLFATSRALGETAPLLFTALGASYINWNFLEPTSALPLLVWNFFEKPGLSSLLWSASFFLLLFCLILSFLAKKIQNPTTNYKS
ncbi:ABC transporter permease subunit [Bacteroidales bacterium OttesenSCG-928-J19]|nr:ABC transporter permease subunit [Bacteroidales bacterium OttesenSCG-928-J19]